MNHTCARTNLEIAREEDILVPLTAHDIYVIQRTASLRLVTLTEELARVIERDRYTVSSDQRPLRESIQDVLEVIERF